MDCELCGKELEEIRKAKVEGAILTVCSKCVSMGEEVQYRVPQSTGISPFANRYSAPTHENTEDEEELAEDYPARIQRARQKMNKTQKEFAAFLNERESIIQKLETGKHYPDDALIQKLEKKLTITLIERV